MRPTRTILLAAVILSAGSWATVPGLAQTQGTSDRFSDASLRKMIASTMCRGAQGRMTANPLTVEAMEFSTLVIKHAIELDPESADLWRVQLGIASATENDALAKASIEKLVKLDPTDETIRLLRLKVALEGFNTLEDRLEALKKLLTPENIERMGPAVASRLALDMAMLLRRSGNTDEFAAALAKALELDSSNREAAALAAGYYRMNANDPFAQAELLTNLLLADPTDIATQVALAQHLLEHGAYVGANRMYALAIRSVLANRKKPTTELLVDQAVAQWASGDDIGALETIRERQQMFDVSFRLLLRREKPELSGMEAMQYKAPVEPTLATAKAAILSDRQDPASQQAVNEVLSGNEMLLKAMSEQPTPPDPDEVARIYLEMAMVSAWLGEDVERTEKLIAEAEKHEPLAPGPKARFDGLNALRRGEIDKALELLTPLVEVDLAAVCGVAMVMEQQGRNREAAEHWLTVSRARPGTVMGIWATGRLSRLLKARLPVTEQAQRMEQLIASISSQIDRYPDDPTTAVSLRVWPEKKEIQMYEPVILNIEIANLSVLPLALDPTGPIRPQIVLSTGVNTANMPELDNLPALVLDIGRRLRLLPHERLLIQIDLRRYGHGRIFDALVRNGAMVQVDAILNFISTEMAAVEAGLYGSEVSAPLIRFEGVRTTPEWMNQALATVESADFPSGPDSVLTFVLLGHKACIPLPRSASQEERDINDRSIKALAAVFHKLNPTQQAWVLSVLPPQPENLEPILAEARKSTDRLVQLAYLLFKASGSSDPIMAMLKAAEDPDTRRLAELTETAIKNIEAQKQREAEMAGPAGSIRTAPGAGRGGSAKPVPASPPPATTQPVMPPTSSPPPGR